MLFKFRKYIFLSVVFLLFSESQMFSMANNFGEDSFQDILDIPIISPIDKLINNCGSKLKLFLSKFRTFSKNNPVDPFNNEKHGLLPLSYLAGNIYNALTISRMINRIKYVKDNIIKSLKDSIEDGSIKDLLNVWSKNFIEVFENNITIVNDGEKRFRAILKDGEMKCKILLNDANNQYRKNLYLTAGILTGIIASYYASKYASKYLFNKIKNNNIGKLPKLVIDTSLTEFLPNKLAIKNLNNLVFPENLNENLLKIVNFIKNSTKNNNKGINSKYVNILISGPSGTGKTTFAKEITKKAGVDYIRISGLSLVDLKVNEAISAINELFSWLNQMAKKPILIIDDIDLFLSKHDNISLNNQDHHIINNLLHNINLLDDKLIILMCSNNKDCIDTEVLNTINVFVNTYFPNEYEREKYISYCKECILTAEKNNKKFFESVKDVLTEKKISDIAKITDGLSNKDLEDLVNSFKIQAYMRDQILTNSIVDTVVYNKLALKNDNKKLLKLRSI